MVLRPPSLRFVLKIALITAIYVGSGKLGLSLAFQNPSVSPVWPPTGIAFSALFLGGYSLWPAVALGAFLTNVTTAAGVWTSLAIAAGNTLEALISVYLIKLLFIYRARFEYIYYILIYFAVMILATGVSAIIGVTALFLGGHVAPGTSTDVLVTWWLGDLIGGVVIAPFITQWVQDPHVSGRPWRIVEVILLTLSLLPVSIVLSMPYSITFLAFIPVVWAAIRFGPRETSTVVLVISAIVINSTLHGIGPFQVGSPNSALLLMQAFTGVASLIGLVLSTAVYQAKLGIEDLEQKVQERTAEMERALAKDSANLRRLETIILHLPVAALLMDEHQNIVEINEAYCTLFHIGLPPAAAKNDQQTLLKQFLEMLKEPDLHMEKVRSALAKRESVYDEEIELNDGRVVQRQLVFIEEDGHYRGQLFLYRDITKERRADRAKSEFMSLASHQLRTPLTTIRWILGRLGKPLAAEDTQAHNELVTQGHAAAVRMAETINTMLKISQVESGKVDLTLTDVHLADVFRDKEKLFRSQYEEKRQIFRIECPESLTLRTDITFFKEILKNLLQNAVKYTPDGGTVILRGREENGSVFIEVEDTGYGIPLHQQKNLFQKFFRGENVVSRDTTGTGLGLYLVSLLAGLLGATISVWSQEKQGTRFTVRFPKHAEETQQRLWTEAAV